MKRDAKINAPPVMMTTYIVRCYEDGELKNTQAAPTLLEAEIICNEWRAAGPNRTAEREAEEQARKLR